MDWTIVGQAAAQFLIDYFSVIVGVICGSLYAVNQKLDVIGTVVLGVVTGYGGGIIRDILLHDHGFFIMQNPGLILVCVAIGVLISAFRKYLGSLESHMFYFDAFSMALFALAGSSKAWGADVGIVLTIALGGITAVGGGALRDICTGKTPGIFQPSNFYAVSGVVGSAAYVLFASFALPAPSADIVCVGTAFALTVLSARFNWRTKAQ